MTCDNTVGESSTRKIVSLDRSSRERILLPKWVNSDLSGLQKRDDPISENLTDQSRGSIRKMDAENRRHSQSPNGELFFLQSAFWTALSEGEALAAVSSSQVHSRDEALAPPRF